MTYKVLKPFKVKVNGEIVEFLAGQEIAIPEEKAKILIDAGKVEPQAIPYELAERMAIMGENCEPEQIMPYVTDSGILVIPFASSQKYHYWKGGQSVCDTLRELGRCDLIPKYKSNLSRN